MFVCVCQCIAFWINVIVLFNNYYVTIKLTTIVLFQDVNTTIPRIDKAIRLAKEEADRLQREEDLKKGVVPVPKTATKQPKQDGGQLLFEV